MKKLKEESKEALKGANEVEEFWSEKKEENVIRWLNVKRK